jgi:hypothetical protein
MLKFYQSLINTKGITVITVNKNTKVQAKRTPILSVVLSSLIISSFLPVIVNAQQDVPKAASLQKKVNPNWWVKPSKEELAKRQKTMSAEQVMSVKQEPASNFIKFAELGDWKQLSGHQGIASIKLSLTYKQKNYQLSVMRMNASVDFSSVLSIWQNKAGVDMGEKLSPELLKNKHDQTFNLYQFKGSKKHIAVAVNKGEKYTFFRLSSDMLAGNSEIPDAVMAQFKQLLIKSVLLR